MLKLCLGFLVDTLFCVRWLARPSIFIYTDMLVLVSEFVVVVVILSLSGGWVGADRCRHIPGKLHKACVKYINILFGGAVLKIRVGSWLVIYSK